MKIALVGHGRIGRVVEPVALGRDHEVVVRIDPAHDSGVYTLDDMLAERLRS